MDEEDTDERDPYWIALVSSRSYQFVLLRSRSYQFALARVALYLSHIGWYQFAGLFALDRTDSHSLS